MNRINPFLSAVVRRVEVGHRSASAEAMAWSCWPTGTACSARAPGSQSDGLLMVCAHVS